MGTKELQGVLEEVLGTPEEQLRQYMERLQQDMLEWARLMAPTTGEINSRLKQVPIIVVREEQ